MGQGFTRRDRGSPSAHTSATALVCALLALVMGNAAWIVSAPGTPAVLVPFTRPTTPPNPVGSLLANAVTPIAAPPTYTRVATTDPTAIPPPDVRTAPHLSTPAPDDVPLPTLAVAPPAFPPPATPPLPPPVPQDRSGFSEQPLAMLSPVAARIAAERDGQITVAIAVPEQGIVYTVNSDTQVRLASTAKVLIMLTLLDQTMRVSRDLDESERDLLNAMITVSNNAATDALWEEIGGSVAVRAFLAGISATGITLDDDGDWGNTTASGKAIALVLARLVGGEILDAPRRDLALQLMAQVIPDQRWGAVTLSPDLVPPETTLAVKNGWYPDDDGWWVTSAGVVIPLDSARRYTIAVLTNGQPSLAYGIETIEAIAREVSASLEG